MSYTTGYYESIFINPFEQSSLDEKLEALRNPDLKKYRVKTIKSGNMLECEIYPIWKTNANAKRIKQLRESDKAQKNLNNKNTRKKVVRLLNANFTEGDIWVTLGYRDSQLPKTEEEAKRDIANYIRRIQRYAEKKGYPKLKYLYVTEYSESGRIHHHIIMNFPDRDIAEKKWGKGKYPQARRLMPDDYGLEGMARYICKESSSRSGSQKSYGYSLNLYKPWEHATVADGKITKAKAEKIIMKRDAESFFEKIYPGYEYKDMEVLSSEYVSGCYIYVRMRRKQIGLASILYKKTT